MAASFDAGISTPLYVTMGRMPAISATGAAGELALPHWAAPLVEASHPRGGPVVPAMQLSRLAVKTRMRVQRRIYAPYRIPRFIRLAPIWRRIPGGCPLFRAQREAWLPPSWISDRRCMSLNMSMQRSMKGYVRPPMRHGMDLYRPRLNPGT